MNDWISARKALSLVSAVGLTGEDLIEWARQGSLRTRAKSGTFSSDDPCDERIFPTEPPKEALQTLGPWPDIPTDLWDGENVKVLWGAATCEATVSYWDDYYQKFLHEHIKLKRLTFNQIDIEKLLNGSAQSEAKPQAQQQQWQKRLIELHQSVAFEFLDWASTQSWYGSLGPVELHRQYVAWHSKNNRKVKRLGRTAFEKWATRYREGWRVGDRHRWLHKP